MTFKRRSGSVFLMGSAFVLVAACGGSPSGSETSSASSDASSSPSAPASEAAPAMTLQFINPLPNQGQWRIIGDCMADEAAAKGLEFTETGSTGEGIDAAAMIEQIQQATAGNKNAIVTFPASDAFNPVLKAAKDAGIVVGTLYGADEPGESASFNVGADFGQWGARVVEAVADRPGDQFLGLVAAGNTGPGKAWMDGVKEAAAATSNVKVVDEVYTGDTSSTAFDQTSALLTANPEINILATHMGLVTQGIASVIESKDAVGEILLVGNGISDGGTEALDSGVAYRMLVQGLCDGGRQVAALASDFLNGKTDVVNLPVPAVMASKDDLTQLLEEGWG
jgi:ABC-type sugar transport system substrate-binding protein